MSVPHDAARPDAGAPAPSLACLAEMLHQGTSGDPSDLVVLCGHGEHSIDVGFWPIPAEVAHPTDVLVGWQPPEWSTTLGLVTHGEARSEDSIDPVRITVVASRSDEFATVLERAGHGIETLAEEPQGWGADALRRCLGLPTPGPDHGLHTCVEGNWLREIIGLLADAAVQGAAVTWDQVALVHPLHPPGWPAAPSQLRAATAALEVESSWERITRLTAPSCPSPTLQPPGGSSVPLARWFDAGSFSRWSMRQLPDVDDLLFEVLDRLDDTVGSAVLDSLVSTTAWC